jgi:hypothetical protein
MLGGLKYSMAARVYCSGRNWQGGWGRAVSLLIIVVFLALDLAIVVGALFWLSRRRAMEDITDLRYRGRGRR